MINNARVWDEYWESGEPHEYVHHTPEIIATVGKHLDLENSRVLEIGVGTGGDASTLASLGARVTGLDFSAQALSRIKHTNEGNNLTLCLCLGDTMALPFSSGSFDLVYHQGLLEHFRVPALVLREQARVLRQGGYLLVDVPQRINTYAIKKRFLMHWGKWPYGGWETDFCAGALSDLVESAGFRVVDSYGRGYSTFMGRALRSLHEIEQRRIGVLPSVFRDRYEALFVKYEKGWMGLHTLQCIGLLGRKS